MQKKNQKKKSIHIGRTEMNPKPNTKNLDPNIFQLLLLFKAEFPLFECLFHFGRKKNI